MRGGPTCCSPPDLRSPLGRASALLNLLAFSVWSLPSPGPHLQPQLLWPPSDGRAALSISKDREFAAQLRLLTTAPYDNLREVCL